MSCGAGVLYKLWWWWWWWWFLVSNNTTVLSFETIFSITISCVEREKTKMQTLESFFFWFLHAKSYYNILEEKGGQRNDVCTLSWSGRRLAASFLLTLFLWPHLLLMCTSLLWCQCEKKLVNRTKPRKNKRLEQQEDVITIKWCAFESLRLQIRNGFFYFLRKKRCCCVLIFWLGVLVLSIKLNIHD